MENVIQIKIAQDIALSFLVILPILLIGIYYSLHLRATTINGSQNGKTNTGPDRPNDDEREITITSKDLPMIQALKFLNYLLALILIVFGFYLIIYYSIIIETSTIMVQTFTIIIWLLILYGFYNLGLPRGGADTKALMAIVIMFPIYPIINGITLDTSFYRIIERLPELGIAYIFPFAFTVLMNAALIMLIYIISLFIYNAIQRNLKFPHAFLGYKLPVNQIAGKFIWPMEQIIDGKRKLKAFPGKDININTEIKKFKDAGLKSVWVTPKIPFLIPMTIGVIITLIVGNLLFVLMFVLM
jgi:preflagellin peptidase FlaK